jgi:hypothetical protein
MSTKSKTRARRRSRMSSARRAAVMRLEKAISKAIDLVRKERPGLQRVVGGPGEFTGYRAVRPGDDKRVKRAFRKQRRVRYGRVHRAG